MHKIYISRSHTLFDSIRKKWSFDQHVEHFKIFIIIRHQKTVGGRDSFAMHPICVSFPQGWIYPRIYPRRDHSPNRELSSSLSVCSIARIVNLHREFFARRQDIFFNFQLFNSISCFFTPPTPQIDS